MTNYDIFSPTDFRYSVEGLKPYLTEEAYVKYKAKVEAALVKTLAKNRICSAKIADEIIKAASKVTASETYREEARIKHDIRALANMIRKRVSNKAKPYVHLGATSYDIVDTANVLRYKDAARNVIIPDMLKLLKLWIALAKKYRNTVQMGRTHGQHAEPITFGFTMAQYINRWGDRIENLKSSTERLVGKFSGAVGAYNATSILFNDPVKFEKEVLAELGLKPANISTQVVPPEPVTDFLHSLTSSFGVIANFSDDMRHLQRSEISEVCELQENNQVGSSTMPQKKNPINFENVKSMFKIFMPRMVTVYLDMISEHQRDLTNSCSQRYIPELLVGFDSSVLRIIKVSGKLQVDEKGLAKNFNQSRDKVVAEPLYIILAYYGHPDAHEYVRELVKKSTETGMTLLGLMSEDNSVKPYFKKFTKKQKDIISKPEKYIGAADKKVDAIVKIWEDKCHNL
ncbi:MAG: adenylosuccinate lyase [Elusimicrobia bacterium]|nr:adenylosuccinate lyase [Elusimicrobiota bacterium]MBU2614092.1 adenylosuccinate lyase [Elusimicrobiota bacterium]